MRWVFPVLLLPTLVVGCAKKGPLPTEARRDATLQYAPSPCAALAFDPPVAQSSPPIELSRENRGPTAFAAFEDPITTYFDIRTDDRQYDNFHGRFGNNLGGRFDRQAYSERVGVTYR